MQGFITFKRWRRGQMTASDDEEFAKTVARLRLQVLRLHLTQNIYLLVLESQLPHKTVNLIF